MAMLVVGIHPNPARIRARHFDLDESPYRFSVVECEPGESGRVDIYVQSIPVLDALQAALDEVRDHLTASEMPAAEMPIADMAPGELVEAWGK